MGPGEPFYCRSKKIVAAVLVTWASVEGLVDPQSPSILGHSHMTDAYLFAIHGIGLGDSALA
jgi:hypothetical protein